MFSTKTTLGLVTGVAGLAIGMYYYRREGRAEAENEREAREFLRKSKIDSGRSDNVILDLKNALSLKQPSLNALCELLEKQITSDIAESKSILYRVRLPKSASLNIFQSKRFASIHASLFKLGFEIRASNQGGYNLYTLWTNRYTKSPLAIPAACRYAATIMVFTTDPSGEKCVLLVKRAGKGKRKDTYGNINKSIEIGESPKEAAYRGLREEVGYVLPQQIPIKVYGYSFASNLGSDKHGRFEDDLNHLFSVTLSWEQAIKLRIKDDKNSELCFVSVNKIPEMFPRENHVTRVKIEKVLEGASLISTPLHFGWTAAKASLYTGQGFAQNTQDSIHSASSLRLR